MSTRTLRPEELAFIEAHNEGSCTGENLWVDWLDFDPEEGTAERGAICGDCGGRARWGERERIE